MNTKKARNRLEEMSELISKTLDTDEARNEPMYEYSASYSEPANRMILGSWKVIEHTVKGTPYAETFARSAFSVNPPEDISYEATYEFNRNMCVKRVLICGLLPIDGRKVAYEYRMNTVLLWDIRGKTLSVQPVTGYQFTSIDGKPVSVRELPPNSEWLHIKASVSESSLVLEDGEDVKTLGRTKA